MKKSKQLELIPRKTNQRFFGGRLLSGKRKSRRHLSTQETIHFVLRSQFASGRNSMRNISNYRPIEAIIEETKKKYGIKIYRQSIQSNHIHLIIKVPNRRLYRCFISVIAGRIASHVMRGLSFKDYLKSEYTGEGCRASFQIEKGQAFWEFRPFNRVLHWGKDFATSCHYVVKNNLEALGFIAYSPRARDRYAKYLIRVSLLKEGLCPVAK